MAPAEIRFFDPRTGSYCWLSNLHPRPLSFEGVAYATPEHAFQVAKARTAPFRRWLAEAPTPELVAIAGDALTDEQTVAGWEALQVDVMARILAAKFTAPSDLGDMLRSTGEARLVEWAPEDGAVARFWGEYQGLGSNNLGRLLMELRSGLRAAAPASHASR